MRIGLLVCAGLLRICLLGGGGGSMFQWPGRRCGAYSGGPAKGQGLYHPAPPSRSFWSWLREKEEESVQAHLYVACSFRPALPRHHIPCAVWPSTFLPHGRPADRVGGREVSGLVRPDPLATDCQYILLLRGPRFSEARLIRRPGATDGGKRRVRRERPEGRLPPSLVPTAS